MKSKYLLILTLMMTFFIVTQSLATTIAVAPLKVPKGAYVNGGGVNSNDNHFWQMVTVTLGTDHPDCGVMVLHLPGGMNVADSDNDSEYSDEISIVYNDGENLGFLKFLSVETSATEITFAYSMGTTATLFPDGDEEYFIMFPVETSSSPTVNPDDYYVDFGYTGFKVQNIHLGATGIIAAQSIVDGVYIKDASGAYGVVVNRGINIFTGNDYIRVIHTGTDFDASNLDLLTKPEEAYAGGESFAITAVGTGNSTDKSATLSVQNTTNLENIGDYVGGELAGDTGTPVNNQIRGIAKLTGFVNNVSIDIIYSGADYVAVDDISDENADGNPLYDPANNEEAVESVSQSAYTGDEIADESGTDITYYTITTPNSLDVVTFDVSLTGNNDATSNYGEYYPTTVGTALYTALPDFVIDGTGDGVWEGENFAGTTTINTTYLFDLDNTEDATESLFYLWASKSNSLTEISLTQSGIYRLLDSASNAYTDNEGSTGNTKQFDVSNLEAGVWYIYVTSPLTGRYPLSMSGSLTVSHHPNVALVAWDRDGAGYVYEAGVNDDNDVTLDTGRYYQYDGTLATANNWVSDLDIYLTVQDFDDNADIKVFYSTDATLDINDIVTTGISPNLQILHLAGAAALKDTTFKENNPNVGGYHMINWDIDPVSFGSVVSADSVYTIYAVATDGTNHSILGSAGADAVADVINIKHSPFLKIDSLSEYGSEVSNSIQVDTSQISSLMLSWGKYGINGDIDNDDSALISFYIDEDTGDDDNPDYAVTQATNLIAAVNGTTTLLITSGILENTETKAGSYYEWDLKDFFTANAWSPTSGTTTYHIYGIIDENKVGGIQRLVTIGDDEFLDTTETVNGVNFIMNNPYVQLKDPPAEGVTVNAEETYRFRFNTFDWDDDADIGIYLVKTETGGGAPILIDGEWGPTETVIGANLGSYENYAGGVRNLPLTQAFLLTSADGSIASASWASEDSDSYYDVTFELPGTETYTKDVNAVAGTLDDAEYWVYIGVDDGSYNSVELTLGSSDDFQLGDYVTEQTTGTTGLVYNIPNGTDIHVYYHGTTGFTAPRNVSIGKTFVATVSAIVAVNNVTAQTDFAGGVIPLYRAPGKLNLTNTQSTPPQRNLSLTPTKLTVARGDTATISLNAADIGSPVDRIDAFIAVDKSYWTLVDGVTPFDPVAAFSSSFNPNLVIDDNDNGRWILRAMIFDSGNTFEVGNGTNIDNTGIGTSLATFQLVSLGTTSAIEEATSIYFVKEPAVGWLTKFSNDGNVNDAINTHNSSVTIQPKGIIEGIVELEGRMTMVTATDVTFELRERGGYTPISDVDWDVNDNDGGTDGIQYTLDNNGKFTLIDVPTGEWDLVVSYDRYISALSQVNVYPGIDTLFVNFGILKGGDCVGWTDTNGYAYPDNQINVDDMNRINTAFLAELGDPEWDDGINNWKWADINEDNIVEDEDLSMATLNSGSNGANPIYKPSVMPVLSNSNSRIDLLGAPDKLKAGDSYTFQVVAFNTAGVRAYFIDLNYDMNVFDFGGISKGDFIAAESFSFPVLGINTVGIVNSVYGDNLFSGDGILAEITFISRVDITFEKEMLDIHRASLVNANHIKEFIILKDPPVRVKTIEPVAFELYENFPNPFNPTTTIEYSIPQNSIVNLQIYDTTGRKITILEDSHKTVGKHSVMWNGRDENGNPVASGIYFYRLQASGSIKTGKMMFLK